MAGMRFVNKHLLPYIQYDNVIWLIREFSVLITLQEDFSQIQKDSLFTYNFAEIKSDLSKILVGHRLDYLQLWYSTVFACFQGRRKRKNQKNHCNKKGKIGNKVIEFNRCNKPSLRGRHS